MKSKVLNQEATTEKLQQKILDVTAPLSRLWKGLEDIKNAPDDTVLVPIEYHIKLIEQTTFLLGQASNSILCSRRLQILKNLSKDLPKCLKHLEGKCKFTPKIRSNFFG